MATISEAFAIAIQHHQAGRLEAAAQIYRQILAVEPNQADALHLLGVIAYQAGNHGSALEYIQRSIGLKGDTAAFHYNLGETFRALRRIPEAIVCYRRAVELQPDYAEVHYNLGNALKTQGNLDEAVACYRRAVELKPDLAEAHNNLGNVFKNQGKLDEAGACYRRALQLKADFAGTHNNLGAALRDQGKLDEAAACYRRALEVMPDYAAAHNNLGNVFKDQGKLDEAIACYRRTLELQPDFAGAYNNLGNAFEDQGKMDEAVACYRQVVQLELGGVTSDPGNRQASAESRPPAGRTCQGHAETPISLGNAFAQLAAILGRRFPESDLLLLRQAAAESNLRGDARAALQFALAQVLDARGEYGAAAKHLDAANAARLAFLKSRKRAYNPVRYGSFVSDVLAAFTPGLFARLGGFGLETERPVFIVGLFRSGTTLAEQILASHSRVFGGGELHYCEETFQSLPEATNRDDTPCKCLLDLDRKTVRRLAQRHLHRLRTLDERALRIVDKMPENYQYLGLIRVLFPQARLIHCRRNLRDVALSCWMTNFTSSPWACDTDYIVSHFEEYLRLMDHWQKVLPAPPLEVDYEQLVEDTEAMAHRIVEWCGLEWEPQCLRFHETQRAVRTASAAQVRRPIYKTSVGRWKNYEKALGELFSRVQLLEETWRQRQSTTDGSDGGCK